MDESEVPAPGKPYIQRHADCVGIAHESSNIGVLRFVFGPAHLWRARADALGNLILCETFSLALAR